MSTLFPYTPLSDLSGSIGAAAGAFYRSLFDRFLSGGPRAVSAQPSQPQAQSSVFINGRVTFPVGDPLGLAFDNGGNLFVSDLGGGHIYKVDRQKRRPVRHAW